MASKPVNEMALAIGGILAGWEIDPGWVPKAGDKVFVGFDPVGAGGQVPTTTTVTLSPFHILVACGMRAGGRGLGQTMQAAASRAAGGEQDRK